MNEPVPKTHVIQFGQDHYLSEEDADVPVTVLLRSARLVTFEEATHLAASLEGSVATFFDDLAPETL